MMQLITIKVALWSSSLSSEGQCTHGGGEGGPGSTWESPKGGGNGMGNAGHLGLYMHLLLLLFLFSFVFTFEWDHLRIKHRTHSFFIFICFHFI